MYTLTTPLKHIQGIGPKSAAKLTNFGINCVRDLLLYLPIRYEDRRLILTIDQLKLFQPLGNQQPTVLAKVEKVSTFRRGRKTLQKATVSDETGKLNLTWFNSPYILQTLKEGEKFYFSGKYQPLYRSLAQPTVEKLKTTDSLHTGRLVPVYSSRLDIKAGILRRWLKAITDKLAPTEDSLAEEVGRRDQQLSCLKNFNQLFQKLHFPEEISDIELARRRLALEELLSLIKKANQYQRLWQKRRATYSLKEHSLTNAIKKLPFTLTTAQTKALEEILTDLKKPHPMNRMLQGDVGSGKTIVAGLAAKAMIDSHQTVCLVAPTRILAQQHQQTLNQLLPELDTQLILGGKKSTADETVKPTLYIGTQALLNQIEKINPGLVIYDEQHRFGVKQRTQISPHLLTMTATPIPRSLMLSVFSYLSLSILNELPKERKITKSWLVPQAKRAKGLAWVKDEVIKTGGLALIVCPFIDPSDQFALENIQAASTLYLELKPFFEPELKIALLHGKLKKDEQTAILEKIKNGETQVLVSTSIIEVGMDLPQASIIMVEEAERFGLASLHQLRGRVGRRNQQGYCLILTKSKETQIISRLSQFTKINQGQELAELDLKNRGAGDLFGLEQHGFAGLQYTTWANTQLIKTAQDLSQTINPDWQSQILIDQDQNLPVAAN